ncbi:MAG: metal-dependent hydrolase, partial [Acetobacteraceae bacterium]|nr:metal-dependent hydrolase [Acetobacteraceae bacterium]
MLAGSHAALGLAAWAWAAPHLGAPALDPMALALAAGGGLLPDLDHPRSWVGRRLRVLSRPLAAAFGHRGATHSLLAVLGASLLLHAHG